MAKKTHKLPAGTSRQPKSSIIDTYNPPIRLLVKIGSILAHVEEGTSDDAHAFDWAAVRSGLADREVQQWLESLRRKSLLPVKRKG